MNAILSGTRKYSMGLVIANQNMQQVADADASIASAVMANCYSRICFRIGDTDAKRMQENFATFSAHDFQQLQVGEAIVRVGAIDNDFSLNVYPFELDEPPRCEERIRERSRIAFGVPTGVKQEESAPRSEITDPSEPVKKEVHPVVPSASASNPPSPTDIREHRYLQTFIKKMAQEYGYIATIECPIANGLGYVDVVLEKEQQKIAIEISVSTTSTWEIHNVQKCLAAGFTDIVVCSPSAVKLQAIREAIQSSLLTDDLAKVQCIDPQEIVSLLQPTQEGSPAATTIKGYRVKVQYDQTGSDKQELIKRIMARGKKKNP